MKQWELEPKSCFQDRSIGELYAYVFHLDRLAHTRGRISLNARDQYGSCSSNSCLRHASCYSESPEPTLVTVLGAPPTSCHGPFPFLDLNPYTPSSLQPILLLPFPPSLYSASGIYLVHSKPWHAQDSWPVAQWLERT